MAGGEHASNQAERRRRFASAWWVIGIACVLGLAVFGAKWWQYERLLETEVEVMENCSQMLLALTVFDMEHGRYPSSFESSEWSKVTLTHNLDWPLSNPFTGMPVEFVPFEHRSPGNMTYIRIPKGQYGEDYLEHDSYWLIVYGKFPWHDRDIDEDGKGDQVRAILGGTSFNDESYPPPQLDTPWKAIQWAEGR